LVQLVKHAAPMWCEMTSWLDAMRCHCAEQDVFVAEQGMFVAEQGVLQHQKHPCAIQGV